MHLQTVETTARRRLQMAAACASALALGAVGVASAHAAGASPTDQHQNGYLYAFWDYAPTSTMTDVDQQVRFKNKAPYTYLAQLWSWEGASDGGYIGLQTDGSRPDGSVGEMAIYSLWNATAAVADRGATCAEFDGEGTGWSCRNALHIDKDHFYRLKVTRGVADADGQWWEAFVRDVDTGKKHGLGSILVAASATSISAPANFSEYFGPAMPTCDDVPRSAADWKRPQGNLIGAGEETVGTYASSVRGDCTGGSASPREYSGTPGVRIVLGGAIE